MKKKEVEGMTAAEAGRIGGKKSKRTLTSAQARKMVEAREKKRHERNEANIQAEESLPQISE